jgi:DNA-binding transcriptional LysR family regulator
VAAAVPRRVTLEVNDVLTLLDLVGHGRGVALVPQDFVHESTTARFVPLADPQRAHRDGGGRVPAPRTRPPAG